ncbi:late competence protein ComER [Bacillus sp. FJAT-45037]|uniref:late competence protein ComER n=1 Tax=Bacillus sp. FJAT-45037 TaxID=2011007 RepID=UPI000C250144|nr:late competence protein ComER [Bacillus sp. FJAT-45037]
MKIGMIGLGSMGTILLESLIESKAASEDQFYVVNRTKEKALAAQKHYPNIHVLDSVCEVAKQSDYLFLCVKPLQFAEVIEEIAPICTQKQLLISITSPISVKQLEDKVDCKVARIIPTILNRALAGPTLISYGERCTDLDRVEIHSLMKHFSEPMEIDENITRVSSDIVSCGPAFFSYLLQQFIDGATRQTEITKDDATTLATNMIIGMGKLLEEGHYTLPTLQKRVCVPGGITGEGIKVLEQEVGHMFDHLFQQTHAKYYHEQKKITEAFSNQPTKK